MGQVGRLKTINLGAPERSWPFSGSPFPKVMMSTWKGSSEPQTNKSDCVSMQGCTQRAATKGLRGNAGKHLNHQQEARPMPGFVTNPSPLRGSRQACEAHGESHHRKYSKHVLSKEQCCQITRALSPDLMAAVAFTLIENGSLFSLKA